MLCKKLFCGFSLQTSCKIIGIIDLLIGLTQAVYLGFQLHPALSSQERGSECENEAAVTQCTYLIIAFICPVLSTLLISATYYKNRNLMLPWLATNITFLWLSFVQSVIESAFLVLSENSLAIAKLSLICCSSIIRVCLWTIVCKFYRKLEREDISIAALRAAVVIKY